MEHLKRLSAETALNNMMSSSRFDICAVRDAARLLGVNPQGEAFDILHPLHCIDWDKMPPELREAIPGLIEQCIGMKPNYVFRLGQSRPALRVIDITPQPTSIEQSRPAAKPSMFRLLGGR